jgi:hypothetical protein
MGTLIPWLIRLTAPYLLRLLASGTIRKRLAAHRDASHAFFARLKDRQPT